MDYKKNQNSIIPELLDDINKHISKDIEDILNKKEIKGKENLCVSFDKFKVFNKINDSIISIEHNTKKKKSSRIIWACASIIVVLILNIGLLSKNNCFDKDSFQTSEVSVKKGEKLLVILADGSRVWLNSDSKLSYSNFSQGKTRDVKLEGEAYFEVAKHREKPFIVHIEQMSITVLGTSFNVKGYSTETVIKTTLDKGEIQIKSTNSIESSHRVKPGQVAIYSKKDNTCQVVTSEFSNEASMWKSNYLSFRNDSLEEVLNTLARKFNFDFVINNVHVKSFTYTFTTQSNSLEEIIKIMESITPLNIKFKNNVLLISQL